jgi:hypothetical protein
MRVRNETPLALGAFVDGMRAWAQVTRGVTAHDATNGGVQLWLRISRP